MVETVIHYANLAFWSFIAGGLTRRRARETFFALMVQDPDLLPRDPPGKEDDESR